MSHNTAKRLKSVFFVAEHMATETKHVIVLEINEEHSVQIKKYIYCDILGFPWWHDLCTLMAFP
jgi:hypothetical protein